MIAQASRATRVAKIATARIAITKEGPRFGGGFLLGVNGTADHAGGCMSADAIGVQIMPKLLIMAALAAGLALSACNTVSGAGKDMQSAGAAVTDTANDAK